MVCNRQLLWFPSLHRLPHVLCSKLWVLRQPIKEFLNTNALGYLDSMNFEDVLLARSHLR